MKYGLGLSAVGAWGDPRTMAELAGRAEDAGWDGVFPEDYVFFHEERLPAFDPWVTLAAIAAATSDVTLGTLVTPIARRRIWKVAAEAMTLDHLSNGRMVLGVGLGDGGSKDFGAVNEVTNPREQATALDESLQVLDSLWSGEPVTYQGWYVSVTDVRLPARPVQRPRIPIWVGGCAQLRGPRQRALRWDGSCLYAVPPPQWRDLSADDVRGLKEEARARGNDTFVVVVGGRGRQADLRAEIDYVTSLAEADADWWMEYVPPQTPLEEVRTLITDGPVRARS